MKDFFAFLFTLVFCIVMSVPTFLVVGLAWALLQFFNGGYKAVSYLWVKIGEDMITKIEGL